MIKVNEKSSTIIFLFLLSIISFWTTYYYGNKGVFPVESFSFFDSSFNVLIGKYPIKDFWSFSGIFVDFLGAFFFKIFGINWNSYIFHSSFLNLLLSLCIFFTFVVLGLNKFLSFFYAACISVIVYPITGTPFSYLSCLVFSYLSVSLFILGVEKKITIFWLLLPLTMVLSFFSNQNPAGYINLIIIVFSLYFFFKEKNYRLLVIFLSSGLILLSIFFLILFILKIDFIDFFYQYILFPISIGEGRVTGSDDAFLKIYESFNFKSLVHHFKFIHLILLALIFVLIKNFLNKKATYLENFIIFFLILISISLIFHQLITANQTFIFSLIPFLAGFLNTFLIRKKIKFSKICLLFLFFFVAFCTTKYFLLYNEKRYFMDLQAVNWKNTIQAKNLDQRFNNLQWITPEYSGNPKKELDLLKEAINLLRLEKRKMMVITHYSFISSFLQKDLNYPNRWYVGNSTFPDKKHKYFEYYKNFFKKKFQNENIEIVYIIDKNGINLNNFKIYLDNKCFIDKQISEIVFLFQISECKLKKKYKQS